MRFKLITLGGTFDHLHKGHEAILLEAFRVARRVSIAITSDEMVQTKSFPQVVESFAVRQKGVEIFLQKNGLLDRADFQKLTDIYGSSIHDQTMDAILVTRHTLANARKINTERKKRGFPPLSIVPFHFIRGTDHLPIASTKIREGVEDRVGQVFYSKKLALSGKKLTDKLRDQLRKPMGKLVLGSSQNFSQAARELVESGEWKNATMRIVVGDQATASLLLAGVIPDFSIVDFRIRRKVVYSSLKDLGFTASIETAVVKNPAGRVSHRLFQAVRLAFRRFTQKVTRSFVLRVDGEEDLAALPAVLLAPLSSIVVYGQPPLGNGEKKEGLVVVVVSEEIKQQIIGILREFR